MNSWVKINHDFGVPAARLVFSSRSRVGMEVMHAMAGIGDDPVKLEAMLVQVVGTVRPELKGCSVVGINVGRFPMSLAVDVVHPALPRVTFWTGECEQMLEPCPVCSGPIMAGMNTWCRTWKGATVNVCSEGCCNAAEPVRVGIGRWHP